MNTQETQSAGSLHPLVSPLPCPFCGATKITIEWEPCPPLDATDTNRRWFAECTQCSCQGPFCQKEPQVIPAWNKRANDQALRSAPESDAERKAKHE